MSDERSNELFGGNEPIDLGSEVPSQSFPISAVTILIQFSELLKRKTK